MRLEENQNPKIKREHTSGVTVNYKATEKGVLVTDQSTQDASYTTSLPGDVTGNAFWNKASRAIGAWSKLFLCKVTGTNTIKPVNTQSLDVDSTFAAKTIVSSPASNDHSKVRNLGTETPQTGDYGLVVQSVNQDQHAQFYFPLTPGGTPVIYARVRWNYDLEGDLSEGEIVAWDETTQTWITTEALCWIDFEKSRTVRHETAGDGTIFEIRLVKADVDRHGVVRDLYTCTRCYEDSGKKISHIKTNQKSYSDYLLASYMTDSTFTPWENPNDALIRTTINGIQGENIVPARLPDEWDISGPEDYNYLEIDQAQFGKAMIFRPIRPLVTSISGLLYESAEQVGGATVATYRRKP